MAWQEELHFLVPFMVAAFCGAALGLEREIHRKPAGLRTNMLIAIGAAMFTFASREMAGEEGDPSRIAAQIVTGIGFLGAGTIIRDRSLNVQGLTSAATVWVVAALGILAGTERFAMALGGTVLALVILQFLARIENMLIAWHVLHRVRIEALDKEWIVQRIREQFLFRRIDLRELKVIPSEQGRIEMECEFETSIRNARRACEAIKQLENVTGVQGRVM